MSILRKRCLCLHAPEEEIDILDYSHSGLNFIPSDVFTHERTLEELFVDNNRIQDLPRELFYCQSLRRLNIAENEVVEIPPVIGSLSNLEYLDISKNAIVKLPDSLDGCKRLKIFEASVNPMEGLSEGLCRLIHLSELYLNDCFLEVLPNSFGRLSQLKVLELRENQLKSLPSSMSAMSVLERLDLGMNQLSQLPEVIESLTNLQEFWFDSNEITFVPEGFGKLSKLSFLDGSKNKIEWIAPELDRCINLNDLDLSNNVLQQLPESFGRLSSLKKLKLDINCLTKLPFSIGGLASLVELDVSANNLEELPIGVGLLRRLRTFLADDNFLVNIPTEIGSCSALTILSLRSNNLSFIPDEIGHIANLRVLNLSDNKLTVLPYTLMKLQELKALWLAETQAKPLTHLQSDVDHKTGQRFLTSYLLPQESQKIFDIDEDANSFHASVWEDEHRERRLIQFNFQGVPPEQSQLYRTPTPYPKELKQRMQHIRNLASKKARGNADKSEFVAGRRTQRLSGSNIALGNTESPVKVTSPLMSGRHVLLKANKEKVLKDKARMQQRNEEFKRDESLTDSVSQNIQVSRPNLPSSDTSRRLGGRRESNNNDFKDAESSQNQDVNSSSNLAAVVNATGRLSGQTSGYCIGQEKVIGSSEATVRSLKTSTKSAEHVRASRIEESHQLRLSQPKLGTIPSQTEARIVQSRDFNQNSSNVRNESTVSGPVASNDGIEIMTYSEFVDAMAAQGRPIPRGGKRRHPPSVFVHRQHQQPSKGHHNYDSDIGYRSKIVSQNRRGYDSDVGYREGAGYRSDTGYLHGASSNGVKPLYRSTSEFYGQESGKMVADARYSSDHRLRDADDLRSSVLHSPRASLPYGPHFQFDFKNDKSNRNYEKSVSGIGTLQAGISSTGNQTRNLFGSRVRRSDIFTETQEIPNEENGKVAGHSNWQHQEFRNSGEKQLQSQEMNVSLSAATDSSLRGSAAVGFARLDGDRNSRKRGKIKNKDVISIEL